MVLCLAVLFTVTVQPSFAASTSAAPATTLCTPTAALPISGKTTRLSDWHVLGIELLGLYDDEGLFCGKMEALAFERAPAHTTSGKLQATLFDCNGKNLAQGETIVPSPTSCATRYLR